MTAMKLKQILTVFRIMIFSLWLASVFIVSSRAQVDWITPDHVYMNNIRTVHLNLAGSPLTYPILTLNGSDILELSFDDLDADMKEYYYTIQLCNADWSPSILNTLDYIRGFPENRITRYQFSSIPLQHYTHYTVDFPNAHFAPTRSGNYILKVFLNDDTSQLAFTRRFLVLDNQAGISGSIRQPSDPRLFRIDQKVDFTVDTRGLDVSNPFDQIKVVILQNYRWDNDITNLRPTFIQGSRLVYNTENDCLFPAGNEWRWLDLRSFRLQTERVRNIIASRDSTLVYVLPDYSRASFQYQPYKDIDGMYTTELLETSYDPAFEADYAWVHFTYPAPIPFRGRDLYLFGALTNYECNPSDRMIYNPLDKAYEGTLLLKQGYYDYLYGTIARGSQKLETGLTEGNWWQTENMYTILVYYRSFSDQADELVGTLSLNSLLNRQ